MARTRTSYWSVPALKVDTFCPATKVFSVCAMSPMRTPRSPARARSITTRTSGFPVIKVESTSTTSGTVFSFASMSAEYFVNLSRSGPLTTNCTSALRDPPPEIAATGLTLVRRSGNSFRYLPRISLRDRIIKSDWVSERSSTGASFM